EADYVVIATGSTVNVPSIDGIEDVEYTTSDDVLGSTEFGDTGVVMGFGTVGLEMVPYLSEAAGVDLTVIEHDAAPLDIADDEFGERILDIYREEFGVEVLTHTYEEALEATDDGVVLHTDRDDKHATVEADELFLFTGRRPSLPDGIENTSLEPREGWVDATMRSVDAEGVYVVGDANGRDPILHVAKEQGYKAAENLLAEERGEEPEEYEHLRHRVTFTALGVYPFALLGLTEREAEERGIDHVAVTREASDDGVFKTKDAPRGLAKLVVA
ncbi:MAG: FAD-dependent oxidoreductase, partial [Halobacteria archaeon]|nr:FAD-dependent oxidoreductase [Halobacteria archaeon]